MTEKESNNRAPKVQSMADSVNYQDGSVVSREIIRKSTGTVTLLPLTKVRGSASTLLLSMHSYMLWMDKWRF